MEQTPSSPGQSPELPSVSPPSHGETVGEGRSSEAVDRAAVIERQESRGETAPAGGLTQSIPVPVVTAPTVPVPQIVTDDTVQSAASLPSVANDDDLIEKEWVDRAKKVLAETKDDPRRREEEVTRLQADYLLKRYGRELGSL